MRTLAQRLDVVPMALYKHVANKDELLDAMVDHVVGEIEPAGPDENWRHGIRSRILSSRAALLRHPWAPGLIETRTQASPVVLDHMEAIAASFRAGGFSVDLTHRAMHAIGSRMWGFTQEVFPTQQPAQDETWSLRTRLSSHATRPAATASHRELSVNSSASVSSPGCGPGRSTGA